MIYNSGKLVFAGSGALKVTASTYTIKATGTDGEGFKAYASLKINGGTIHITAYDDAFSVMWISL